MDEDTTSRWRSTRWAAAAAASMAVVVVLQCEQLIDVRAHGMDRASLSNPRHRSNHDRLGLIVSRVRRARQRWRLTGEGRDQVAAASAHARGGQSSRVRREEHPPRSLSRLSMSPRRAAPHGRSALCSVSLHADWLIYLAADQLIVCFSRDASRFDSIRSDTTARYQHSTTTQALSTHHSTHNT